MVNTLLWKLYAKFGMNKKVKNIFTFGVLGLSEMEQPEERISLNDAKRVEYHKAYLASLVQAIR